MKRFLLMLSVLFGMSSVLLVHAYKVKLVNETKYPGKLHVHNKTSLCSNVHRRLKPGESYTEDNGSCMVFLVNGEVFIPKTVSTLQGQTEYQEVKATPYDPPFGRTGTGTDTYVLIQEDHDFGPSTFVVKRR